MSQATSTPDDDLSENDRIAARLQENRDTYERLAGTDLPIAEDAQRALDWLDRYEAGEFDE